MMCHCSREQFMFEESLASPDAMGVMDMSASGLSAKTIEGEVKLDEGNIEEAESSLREALSLNYEEARALLGRLEYQRGNVEAALQVFDGIDISAIIPRMRFSLAEKGRHRRRQSRAEVGQQSISLHAASLLLEAIYLKAKSLQKLARLKEAALECKSILDTIESALPYGVPDALGDTKLQDTVSKSVELLPELYKEAGLYHEAIAAYRRALLNPWNLDSECSGRIQKNFAVLLLYAGVEAGAPSLAAQFEGAFVPKSNIEEAILLLLILLRKTTLRKVSWDYTIMEHLCYALSICGQPQALAQQFEELLPGTIKRADRWYNLALCYSGAKQNKKALNLLRKVLNHVEKPNDVASLLLAAKICTEDGNDAHEGARHAQKALENATGETDYFKGRAHHVLGVALSKKANTALSDTMRTILESKALKELQEAAHLEREDPHIIFDLGLLYANLRNLSASMDCAKKFLELSSGAVIRAWRFLALVLSAQKRFAEAEVIINAALGETGKWEQGSLLRTKAKLHVAQNQTAAAIKTFMLLLALVQAQRKSFSTGNWKCKAEDTCVSEEEVWQDLAGVYTSVSQWHDAEVCLGKAQISKPCSAATWHARGILHEARGQDNEAISAYNSALTLDPEHVQSKVSLGAILRRCGKKYLPVVRSLLTDALHSEPKNHAAWYHLGILHEEEGRLSDASECFQAAFLLEQSAPVETFSTLG